MEPAGDATVLADFEAHPFEHRGQRFAFRRDGEAFVVRMPGADGAERDFEVAYTFGVDPLQQYLVRFPRGRLQALGVAWDVRGGRWFHLHPDEAVPPDDVLHWTGRAGSWNAMCADCHSTHVSTGYRPADDTYTPTWSEVDVACEACHGTGSRHVAWAEGGGDPVSANGLQPDLRSSGDWVFPPGESIARRQPPLASRTELETCAPCHSRRSRIAPWPAPGAPLLDGYRPALLEEGLYHVDGQMQDEVYVWGSFLQSRMYANGVTCSDCHDPHALEIEVPDAVCAGCHATETYASPAHHHHAVGSPGASCVECHMPARTYMVIDARRDHSFRVPRPDLSRELGVPNACTDCHVDRDDDWATQSVAGWYGSSRADDAVARAARALHTGRRREPGAADRLAAVADGAAQPAIVRATALQLLGDLPPASTTSAVRALADADPLVRMAAVRASEAFPPDARPRAVEPLLRDPVRAVRIEAARVLARRSVEASESAELRAALAEYQQAQEIHADRPEAHLNLGLLHAARGDLDAAASEYETAIRLAPDFVPSYVNLADLHRLRDGEDAGERVLREGLGRVPGAAELHHALGLLLVRQSRADEALRSLGRAASLEPAVERYAYVYGVALHSRGDVDAAIGVLEASLLRHPSSPHLLGALAAIHRDAGHPEVALRYARRLVALRPEDPEARALVRTLERLR